MVACIDKPETSKILTEPGKGVIFQPLRVDDLAIWRLLDWLCGEVLDGIPNDLLESHSRLEAHFKGIDGREDVPAWMKSIMADHRVMAQDIFIGLAIEYSFMVFLSIISNHIGRNAVVSGAGK